MSNSNLKLNTNAQNTWCPGCTNFAILSALKQAILSLIKKGTLKRNIVVVSGIGCAAKITDYLDLNTLCSLHGRPVAAAEGVKLGNPNLKVIVSMGDGGCYDEGISHLIHAAKRNIDITVLVHDNRTFALTTGQFTATSPEGFKGGSTPKGSIEEPFNPLELMLASNASFIAREYAFKIELLGKSIEEGIKHKGFSFIDILQPCITFFNTTDFYNQRVYRMKEENLTSKEDALKKIKEWNYEKDDKKIPLGIFYKKQKPTYEKELLGKLNPSHRNKKINLKKLLENIQNQ